MKIIKENKIAAFVCLAIGFGLAFGAAFAIMGANYGDPTYNAPFQIHAVTGTTQTVSIGNGCTLGSDTGSKTDLSAGTVTLPGLNLNASQATVPSGGTLSSAAGSTVNLSSGTLTLPTFAGTNFVGINGAGTASLVGSTSGQRVVALWDVTGGTATAAGGGTLATNFATTITGTGQLVQTGTGNLSSKTFSAILMNTGP